MCKLIKGSVVQVRPDHKKIPGCFVVVTEPKSFGCQGYVLSPIDTGDSLVKFNEVAYIRLNHEDFEYIGECPWILRQDGVEYEDE